MLVKSFSFSSLSCPFIPSSFRETSQHRRDRRFLCHHATTNAISLSRSLSLSLSPSLYLSLLLSLSLCLSVSLCVSLPSSLWGLSKTIGRTHPSDVCMSVETGIQRGSSSLPLCLSSKHPMNLQSYCFLSFERTNIAKSGENNTKNMYKKKKLAKLREKGKADLSSRHRDWNRDANPFAVFFFNSSRKLRCWTDEKMKKKLAVEKNKKMPT